VKALALVLVACTTEPGPQLDAVAPAAAAHDATVMLSGERLCGTSNDCMAVTSTLQIGLALPVIDAVITDFTATSARIVVPELATIGKTELVITVNNRSSNALAFEVLP
jgi:hypothetical protein